MPSGPSWGRTRTARGRDQTADRRPERGRGRDRHRARDRSPRAGRRGGRRSRRSVGRVRQVAITARRHRRRPAGRHDLPGMPPPALGGRDRPHPPPRCRRARALRVLWSPPRPRLIRRHRHPIWHPSTARLERSGTADPVRPPPGRRSRAPWRRSGQRRLGGRRHRARRTRGRRHRGPRRARDRRSSGWSRG